MDLPHSYQLTLATMPDLSFGEDQNAYTKKVTDWARGRDIATVEAIRCAKIKWKAWEVERLILEIEEGSTDAAKKALVMLLKETYIV